MNRTRTIIYWIATCWLALGMASTGIVQLTRQKEEVASITSLGYPPYLLILLGTWKLLGIIAILVPRTALLKEWAYAGFFFAMTGAAFSRISAGSSVLDILPSLLLLTLTFISWWLRPPSRKTNKQLKTVYTS
ncbi:MAG: DoxX family protein [Sphingobacteriales bacterium]|nr:MAG: DoxX family protein [Sphingobacteriales bacterium]